MLCNVIQPTRVNRCVRLKVLSFMEVMQCLLRSLLLHGVLLDFRQRGRVSVDLAPILGGREEETVDRKNCRDHDHVILAEHLVHLGSKFSNFQTHVGDVAFEFGTEVGDVAFEFGAEVGDVAFEFASQ